MGKWRSTGGREKWFMCRACQVPCHLLDFSPLCLFSTVHLQLFDFPPLCIFNKRQVTRHQSHWGREDSTTGRTDNLSLERQQNIRMVKTELGQIKNRCDPSCLSRRLRPRLEESVLMIIVIVFLIIIISSLIIIIDINTIIIIMMLLLLCPKFHHHH